MIADYLDQQIEQFRKRTGDYPPKIIMPKETQQKLYSELERIFEDDCWIHRRDNYRGIKIENANIQEIKLE